MQRLGGAWQNVQTFKSFHCLLKSMDVDEDSDEYAGSWVRNTFLSHLSWLMRGWHDPYILLHAL